MKRCFVPLTLITLSSLLACSAHYSTELPRDAAARRYKELTKIINHNVGYAHMTRGFNVCTILALLDTVTESDLPLLRHMLDSEDYVYRMTAGNVLSIMGESGANILRVSSTRLGTEEAAELLARAPKTQASVEAYRSNGQCRN